MTILRLSSEKCHWPVNDRFHRDPAVMCTFRNCHWPVNDSFEQSIEECHSLVNDSFLWDPSVMCTRARWDWSRRPKFQNWDLHTWILMGNWILNLICFLQFFDLSTPFAVLLRFYFLPFLHGKNAQNRPENQQNWNLAKIGLKSDIFMK